MNPLQVPARPGIRAAAPLLPLTAIAAALLTSCFRDDGFISPSDKENQKPLGVFIGRSEFGADTAIAGRLKHLKAPRLAVHWRAVGLKDILSRSEDASVDAKWPFDFSYTLRFAPPAEVLAAPEIAFGVVTLYHDGNGNGKFDRLVNPALEAGYARIDSLVVIAREAKARLHAAAEVRARQSWSETFHQDSPGTLVRAAGGPADTLWIGPLKGNVTKDVFAPYQRMLANGNRWERFFAVRKKVNEFHYREFTVPGHALGVEVRFDRSLFPKPGREAEFAARLREAVEAQVLLTQAAHLFQAESFLTGKFDYPFQGFEDPGTDWIAGRTIQDLLLYLHDQASLDSLVRAFPASSFQVSHAERLRPGFNLFRCDDQYTCEVRARGDSILIWMGTTEAFFNAPATPSRNPFLGKPPVPVPAVPEDLSPFAGRYALNGSDTLSLAVRAGGLWYESSASGLLRVVPRDSFGFYSPHVDLQGVLSPALNAEAPARLVQYTGRNRFVAMLQGPALQEGFLSRIDQIAGFTPVAVPESALARCAGAYGWLKDTLKVVPSGDSLQVRIPGFSPMGFRPRSDSVFRFPWGEWGLEFQGWAGNRFNRVVFANGARKIVVPNLASLPSKSVSSSRTAAPFAEAAAHAGSAPDAYRGLNGRSRYSCGGDGLFLRPGDGYFSGFRRASGSDSISLRQGGDEVTFRIEGQAGKTAVLEARHCAERGIGKGRIRVSVWGGSDPESRRLLYGDHQWMEADTSGTYWSFDSLAVASDPWYLTVKEEDTPDAPFLNAFEGYRLGIRP